MLCRNAQGNCPRAAAAFQTRLRGLAMRAELPRGEPPPAPAWKGLQELPVCTHCHRGHATPIQAMGVEECRHSICKVAAACVIAELWSCTKPLSRYPGVSQAATQAALSDLLAGLKRDGRKQLTVLLIGTSPSGLGTNASHLHGTKDLELSFGAACCWHSTGFLQRTAEGMLVQIEHLNGFTCLLCSPIAAGTHQTHRVSSMFAECR